MNGKITDQMGEWSGNFGKEYTDRNIYGVKELDRFYLEEWGEKRTDMNEEFLSSVKNNITSILEVGSNVGNQLACLQTAGFRNLYGIEIQEYAIQKSKEMTEDIYMIKASALDIPFKDSNFDLVFTSGVLIHISPDDINTVLDEIYRCSKRYIWGFEYYADDYTEIEYRGEKGLLWKTDFCRLFTERFPNIRKIKEKKYKYVKNDNVDSMFLLEKAKV